MNEEQKLRIEKLDGACFQGGPDGLKERDLYGVFLGDDVKGFGFDVGEVMMMAYGLASHLETEVKPYIEPAQGPVPDAPEADFFVPAHFLMGTKRLFIDGAPPNAPYKQAISSVHAQGMEQLFADGIIDLTREQIEEYKKEMREILQKFPDTAMEASSLIQKAWTHVISHDKSLDPDSREDCNEVSRRIVKTITQGLA